MDKHAHSLMDNIAIELNTIMSDNLVGIYIHGSLAFGCFVWENSDIDFIVVTKKELSLGQKRQIIQFFLDIDKKAPPKGIEVSFVLEKDCKNFIYPTPYHLHFSNAHIEKYTADMDGHINKLQDTDKDLAAHFTVINHVGITFYGRDKSLVFSPVPREYYIDSIKFDIENAVEDIQQNTVYLSLNLCRVLAYIKEGTVLSKAQGGIWGMENIPQYKSIIEKAYMQYTQGITADFYNEKLKEFAEYMLSRIFK